MSISLYQVLLHLILMTLTIYTQICEVVGVTETPKIYTLGSTKTNKGLKLR